MNKKIGMVLATGILSASLTVSCFAADGNTVGINNWFSGAYALDILCNNAKQVIDTAGDNLQIFNDEGNAETVITDLENMLSSGVNGIMWMGMFENNFAVGPAKMNDAKTYFSFYDKIPTDDDTKKQIKQMEYFAGGTSNDNYEAGQMMAEQALNDGCKSALLAGAEIGDPNTAARIAGFQESFEKGGGKILSVSRVTTGEANGPQQACDNMYAAYPEADCFYCSGESFTLAALTVKSKSASDVKVYGTDLNPTLLEYLKDGSLSACCGASWVTAVYSAIMLENAMEGHRLVDEDGLPAILDNVHMISVTSSQADLYEKLWINELPYEESEISNLLYANNPNVTLQDLVDMANNYSFEERVQAKFKAGKVSEDELTAAGITLDGEETTEEQTTE